MRVLHALKYNPEYSVHIGDEKGEVSEDRLYVSEEEYWEKYYNHPDFSYEWNNGYLEEKPMTDYKGSEAYQWFLVLLRQFLEIFPIAKMVGLEFGFRLALPREKRYVRKPDLAVVLNDNPVMLHSDDQSYKGTFDICIESLSYSTLKEIKRDTVDKKKEYQGVGVREYYILDARGIETAFYHKNRKGKYQKTEPEKGEIIRSEVLPGFQFRIKDLYKQPSLEKLTEDEVYQGYVLPFHQKVKQKAESERQRAEQISLQLIAEHQRAEQVSLQLIAERQRAEQAEHRAALLADKLKLLGISVE
jgi:Uma2 family endonuclease